MSGSPTKPRSRRWLPLLVLIVVGGGSAAGIWYARRDIPTLGYEVVAAYPHDPTAWTQGLVWYEGRLYESTGLYGKSEIREVRIETGEVIRREKLAGKYFAEGLAVRGDRLYQITWKEGKGFIRDPDTLAVLEEFRYRGDGWGLCWDGESLILSDGSAYLRFLDPKTFKVRRKVRVTADGSPVTQLNELEFIDNEIWANIWQQDRLARIDPDSGQVTAWIDLSGLLDVSAGGEGSEPEVLNGIAWDAEGERLFVTGKNWPKLYEIRVK